MARITVEDCLGFVDNRFELVLKASKRAHKIEQGLVDPFVPLDNDKPTVIALREIADGFDITDAPLKEEFIFINDEVAAADDADVTLTEAIAVNEAGDEVDVLMAEVGDAAAEEAPAVAEEPTDADSNE